MIISYWSVYHIKKLENIGFQNLSYYLVLVMRYYCEGTVEFGN